MQYFIPFVSINFYKVLLYIKEISFIIINPAIVKVPFIYLYY